MRNSFHTASATTSPTVNSPATKAVPRCARRPATRWRRRTGGVFKIGRNRHHVGPQQEDGKGRVQRNIDDDQAQETVDQAQLRQRKKRGTRNS